MQKRKIITTLALSSCLLTAQATQDGPLVVSFMATLCLESYEAMKSTELGTQLVADPIYQAWRQTVPKAQLQCIIRHNIVSERLCTAILSTGVLMPSAPSAELMSEIGTLADKLNLADRQCTTAPEVEIKP